MADGPPSARSRLGTIAGAALLGLPALAILIAAMIILGPGRARPAIGAKVWGVPAEGTRHLALRIHLLEQFGGAVTNHGDQDIRVELFDTPTPPWDGRTDGAGVVDARLESVAPLVGEVQIRVTSGRRTLANERIMLRPIRNRLAARQPVPGAKKGELQLDVTLPRGAMSPPFPERTVVVVRDRAGEPIPQATVTGEGPGLQITPEQVVTDGSGRASFDVAVHTINPELTLRATVDALSGTWHGGLPVLPGSIWLEPIDAAEGAIELHLASPTPRKQAYLSLLSNRGRELGRRVVLTEHGGFHRGVAHLELPRAQWLAVTLTADPYEQSDATVTWPLGTLEGEPELQPLDLLIDGMPAAERREVARAWSMRRSALVVLGVAALLEVLLLALRSREAERALDAHIARATQPGDDTPDEERIVVSGLSTRQSSRALTLLFAVLVALAFAIVGALAYIE